MGTGKSSWLSFVDCPVPLDNTQGARDGKGVSGEENVRVLIDERGAVVDLVVHDEVEVLLSVVLSNLLEGEFLVGRHDE